MWSVGGGSGGGGGGSALGSKPRGPPPGLVKTSVVNGWNNGPTARSNNSWASQTNLNNWSGTGTVASSTWLLLRNLTAQVSYFEFKSYFETFH